jgi:amino acid adenylation domain-containing protein/non-ribosomal peptide synthase protein (TIGR01720 family)
VNSKNVKTIILDYVKEQKLQPEIAANLLRNLSQSEVQNNEAIAVIGLEAYFAGSENSDAFWNSLLANKSQISSLSTNRMEDIKKLYTDVREDQFFKAGFLSKIDQFDESFFRLSPKEAALMDPKQRIFLETAYHSLEDAGYGNEQIRGSRTGIFVGVDHSGDMKFSYLSTIQENNFLATTGNSTGILASRISYILNLTGPSVVIDTACSSSLVAVHYACSSLRNKECEMAIAGGINIFELPLDEQMMMDIEIKNSKFRAFDRKSAGTAWGEGAGAVVLKPFAQAVKDNDRIYAVIQTSAINNDGASNGITAPNQVAQTELIVDTWKKAGINPEKISYIETHGTGTVLGDPIEIKGITNAFRKFTTKQQFCGIGTIKPNIGHCVGASGIASFIKVALSLKQKMIPATIGFNEPNLFINFVNSPVYVLSKNKNWDTPERFAGVSSFGFSGTNCHMLLSSYDETDVAIKHSKTESEAILCVSALNNDSFNRVIRSYIEFLEMNSDVDIFDFAYTNNRAKQKLAFRYVFVVKNRSQLIQDLKKYLSHEVITTEITTENAELRERFIDGKQIDWSERYSKENRKKISLPKYPFAETRHWSSKNTLELKDIEIISLEKEISPLERDMAFIWANVFGLNKINITDNFYQMGGDSILASTLANHVTKFFKKKLEIRQIFEHPTVLSLAAVIEQAEEQKEKAEPIPKAVKKAFYPVTYEQRQIYLAQRLQAEYVMYNISICMEIKGKVDEKKVEKALEKLMLRHRILKSNFYEIDGDIVQIENAQKLSFETITVSDFDSEVETERFIKPFDLSKDTLFRAKLYKLENEQNFLLIDTHHIVADGYSIPIIERDFLTFYSGGSLEPLDIQFNDYSEWVYDSSANKDMNNSFWHNQLECELKEAYLPFLGDRNNQQKKVIKFNVPHFNLALSENKNNNFALFILALSIILYKYTGESNTVIGSPFLGRSVSELEQMVGMFVKTLPICTSLKSQDSVIQLLDKIETSVAGILDNQRNATRTVDNLLKKKGIDKTSFFQVLLAFQESREQTIHTGNLEIRQIPVNTGNSKYPISIYVFPEKSGFKIEIQHQPTIVSKKEIEKFSKDFLTVINMLNKVNSTTKVSDIVLNRNAHSFLTLEKKSIFPDNFQERFKQVVKKYPDRLAIKYNHKMITYKELDLYSNNVAAYLMRLKVEKQEKIGILLPNSESYLVSLIGIMKHRCIFVPLDSEAPTARNATILKNNNIKFVITKDTFAKKVPKEIIIIDEKICSSFGKYPHTPPEEQDIAYIIHTSGTTGKPKGVPILNQALTNYAVTLKNELSEVDFSKAILTSQLNYDLGYTSVFVPLLNGGQILIVDKNEYVDSKKLSKRMKAAGTTYLKITPSLFSTLNAKDFSQCTSLSTVIFGGEVAHTYNIRNFKKELPWVNFINHYGPTEGTVGCIVHSISEEEIKKNETIQTLGFPIWNTGAIILNKSLEKVPNNVIGELFIYGINLSPGYLKDTELNTQCFYMINGKRLYATGDLARYGSDGCIEYMGRKDNQVKHMGYRVELSEITNTALNIEEISQANTIFYNDSLLLFFTGNQTETELAEQLKKKLPAFMLPSNCRKVQEIPLLSNGKVNYQLLIDSYLESQNTEPHFQQLSVEEEIVSEAWKRVLNINQEVYGKNFFELGGNSLKSIQLINHLRKSGYSISLSDIYQYNTVERLAKHLVQIEDEWEGSTVEGSYPLTPNQNWMIENFSKTLNHHNLSFNLETNKTVDIHDLEKVMNKILSHHDALRTIFIKNAENDWKAFISKDANYGVKEITFETYEALKVEEFVTGLHKSISLSDGKNMIVGIQHYPDRTILNLVINQMVVDHLSWRIILDDITHLYDELKMGNEGKLASKTVSFIEWTNAMTSTDFSDERDFWNNMETIQVKSLASQNVNKKISSVKRLQVDLGKTLSNKIYTNCRKKQNVEDQFILTLLLKSLEKEYGHGNYKVSLGNYGRYLEKCSLDVSRTVGRFSAVFPITFSLAEKVDVLGYVNEVFKAIPNKGIGYGHLKYKKKILKKSTQPEISYNFMGEFDNTIYSKNFKLAENQDNFDMDKNTEWPYFLKMTVIEKNGSMNWLFDYNTEIFSNERLSRIVTDMKERIELI